MQAQWKFLANPAAAPAFGKGVTYGNGIGHYPIDESQYLHHTGGMVSVVSSLHVDADADVAALSLTLDMRPRTTARKTSLHACNLLRSLNTGVEPPAPKPPRLVSKIRNGIAGVYTSARGID